MDINHPVWGSPMAMETSIWKKTSNWSNVSLLNPPLTCGVSGLPSFFMGEPQSSPWLFQYESSWSNVGWSGVSLETSNLILFGMLWPPIKVAPRGTTRTNSCPLRGWLVSDTVATLNFIKFLCTWMHQSHRDETNQKKHEETIQVCVAPAPLATGWSLRSSLPKKPNAGRARPEANFAVELGHR